MENNILENILIILNKEKENYLGIKINIMKENGLIINHMEMECIFLMENY
jgi:hypothetical protein